MENRIYKILIALLLIVFIAILVKDVGQYDALKAQYEQEIELRDKLIAEYEHMFQQADSAYLSEIQKIDSIQHLRNENDTATYHYSADSLQKLWAKRFHNH